MRRSLLATTALVGLATFIPVGGAAAQTWTGGGGNFDWFNGSNWSPPGPPTASTDAIVDNNSTANPVAITTAGAVAKSLDLGSAVGRTGALSVSGAGTLNVGTGDLYVGNFGTGVVTVSDGGKVTATFVVVANNVNSNGSVRVTGAGSEWSSGTIYISADNGAVGTFEVTDGAKLTATSVLIGDIVSGSNGTLTISGQGSTFTASAGLTIAPVGRGTFNVLDGAVATTNVIVSVASAVGGTTGVGSVTISGAGSSWTTGNLLMGTVGRADVTIADGATVSSTFMLAGAAAAVGAGSMTVEGEGSSWTISGTFSNTALIVSGAGNGTSFTVRDGGQVIIANAGGVNPTNADFRLGTTANGTVTALIDGAGSTVTTPWRLFVGQNTNSKVTLTVSNGGKLNTGFSIIGSAADATASTTDTVVVTGAGSVWTISDTVGAQPSDSQGLTVGSAGRGVLTIADGGVVRLVNPNSSVVLSGSANSSGILNIGAPVGSPAVAPGTLDASRVIFATTSPGPMQANFNHSSGSYVFAPQITGSGPGAVNILAGTTIFTANNTYTGTTTISSGATLQLGNGGANGSITTGVTVDGALVFNRDTSGFPSYAGVISGAGTVTFRNVGSGNLTLSGNSSGFTGTVTVAGGQLFLSSGRLGSSSATIGSESGVTAQVQTFGATAALTVGATGPTALIVGTNGATGTLLVTSSSLVDVSGAGHVLRIGEAASTGSVRIDSSGRFTGNLVEIGAAGTGQLTILSGGTATQTGAAVIGRDAGSTGTASIGGAASRWTTGGTITVGDRGTGTLTIGTGAQVDIASTAGGLDLVVADEVGSTGTVNIGASVAAAQPVAAGTLLARGVVFGAGTGALNFRHTAAAATPYVFSLPITETVAGRGTVNVVAGATSLTGTSTYTGPTNVNGGTLFVDGSLGNTAVSVASGASLGGSGSIGGSVSVANGGTLIGRAGQTLAMGALSLNADSSINASLGAPSTTPLFTVGGAFTLDGRLDVTDAGGFTTGTYRLVNYSGTFVNNGLVVTSVPAGTNPGDWFIDVATSGQVNLITAPASGIQYWDGPNMTPGSVADGRGGTGVWNATNTNWTNQAGNINAPWVGQNAIFAGAGAGTVTVEGAQAFTGLAFHMAPGDGNFYTLVAGAAGGLVTNAASTPIEVVRTGATGGASIGVPISGTGGIVKTGNGDLLLTTANSYAGGTTVSNGTLVVTATGALSDGPVSVLGTPSVRPTLDFVNTGASVSAGSLAITVGDGTVRFSSGTTAGSATVINNSGGEIVFRGTADAGSAAITNNAGATLSFADETNAATATVVNNAGGIVDIAPLSGAGAEFNIGSLSGAGNVTLGESILALGALGQNDEIGGVISDGASARPGLNQLVKTGSGTLTLSGINTYTGFTTVRDGRLLVNGSIVADVGVFQGALGGTGSIGGNVTIVGAGAALEGRSGQTLTMGSLTLNPGASVNVALGAPSNSRLFNVVANVTLDGNLNITNAGGFGLGVYRLFDYGGTLTDNGLDIGSVPAGTNASDLEVQTAVAGQVNLVVGTTPPDPIPEIQFWNGSRTVANGTVNGGTGAWTAAPVTNWTDANGNRADPWNGNFAVFQGTAGTVTVDDTSGAVSATGMQFAVTGYRVEGAAIGLAGAGGSTTIRVGDGSAAGAAFTATLAAALTGPGGLVKTDLGTLVLENTHAYAGATRVDAGRLVVNGSIAGSPVTIAAGAVLAGSGVVGGIAVQSGATAAPGNSIGTLNVTGNVNFAAGSFYEVEVDDAGNGDRIAATGTATIDGGTVTVVASPGNYAMSTTYTILTADGGRTGTFDTVTSNFAFLVPTLSYDPNSVFLILSRNSVDFASIGATGNQQAVGTAVEALGSGNPVFDSVVQLDPADARHAFDQLSGEIHASLKTVLLDDSRFVRDAAINRVRAAFGGVASASGSVGVYGPGGPQRAAADTDRFAFWAHGFGSWGHWGGGNGTARLERSTGGFLLGADGQVVDTWRLGVLGGYSRTSFDVGGRSSSGSSNNYHVGLYGGNAWGPVGLRFGGAYTWHDITTKRSIAYPGFFDSAKGDYDAGTAQAFGELGYRVSAASFAFEPFAGLAYVNLRTDGFGEEGGPAALGASKSHVDMLFTTIGLRASAGFKVGEVNVAARGMVGWRHAFGDTVPTADLAFAGGDTFSIAGVPIARNAAVVEVGLDIEFLPRAVLGITYSGQFGRDVVDQGVKANLTVRF